MASLVLSDLLKTLKTTFAINKATFDAGGLTAARTFTLPDVAGTLALTSQLYTDEQAQDAVAAALTETAGIDITYNDAGATITFALDLAELTAVTSPDYVNDSVVINRAGTGDRIHGLEALTASQQSDFHKRRRSFFMDFETIGSNPLLQSQSGSGASGGLDSALFAANQIGVRQLGTGSTTTGRAAVTSGASAIRLGNGAAIFEGSFSAIQLSDGTERFQFRIGFIDTLTGDQVDGVYFEYADDVSANWQVCTASNSARTKTASATAVDTGWHTFKIVVNAAGSSASFYIDGTEVSGSPITTNIPTGSGRETGWGFMMIKSAGTTSRNVGCDWLSWDFDLTTPRT